MSFGKYASLATRIKCFKQTLGILLSACAKIKTIPKSWEHIFYCSHPALELETDYHKDALFRDGLNIKQMYSSVQFSRSDMSDSLRPHELQHTRPPCPSPTPGVNTNSCPSSRWCHPDVSSSVVPFSSCPKSLPASASSPMSQLFTWGGQSTGVSALASFLPKNTQKSQHSWVLFYSIIWPLAKVPSAPFGKGSINTSVWGQILFKDATHSGIFRFRASDCLTSVHKLKHVFLVLSHLNHLGSKVS